MDWYDVTTKYQKQTLRHDGQLSSLAEEWQRELAALWRLEDDVNNGAYLQFFSNWGRESYVYASQALKKIGARRVAEIVDRCQALIDEHFNSQGASHEQRRVLMHNPIIGRDGNLIKPAGSSLPNAAVERIRDLSYEFMDYPENIAALGLAYYRGYIEEESAGIKSGAPPANVNSPRSENRDARKEKQDAANPKESLSGQQAYNLVTDTIAGPNLRLKDNLYQGPLARTCV